MGMKKLIKTFLAGLGALSLSLSPALSANNPSQYIPPSGSYSSTQGSQINYLTPQMFGAKCDGTTDDSTALQAAENAAAVSKTQAAVVYIGPNLCVTSVPLTPGAGVDHFCFLGQNYGDSGEGVSNRCGLKALVGSSFYGYDLELPNGISSVQAPTFHDMYITGNGGCIRLNNPNNGFTNDNTSQEYMLFARFDRINCAATTIGVQCSKCISPQLRDGTWSGGNIAIDFEGSDDVLIDHPFILGFTDLPVKFASHATFGNNDILTHAQINCPFADANGVACVYSSARNATIRDNYIECQGTFAVLPAAIVIDTGNFHTVVDHNTIDCGPSLASHGLVYTGDPYLLSWTNNGSSGVPYGSALFNSGAGIQTYINSTNLAQVFHFGNSNESGFPVSFLNNQPEWSGQQTPGLLAFYVPGSNSWNVNNTSYGSSVKTNFGAWDLPSGTKELDFNTNGSVTGTVDVCFLLQTTSGSNSVTLTALDGSTSLGTATPTVTTGRSWTCISNVTASTAATAKAVSASSGVDVFVFEVAIRQHGI